MSHEITNSAPDYELSEIARNVELLSLVEARQPGFARGHVFGLATAIRQRIGAVPAFAAAEALIGRIKPGDRVLIVSGAGGHPWLPAGETDGPPGAAALARAMHVMLGATPVFGSEPEMLRPLAACAKALGFQTFDFGSVGSLPSARPFTALTVELPWEPTSYDRSTYERILDEVAPAALIAIEKLGPNAEGVYHSALGGVMESGHAPAHLLFEFARDRQILTVGIGDNGNEIGFGRFQAEVEAHHPLGSSCRCECGGSVADSTDTTHTIVANVSNWGAYAVEACLAAILGQPWNMHTSALEAQSIQAAVAAGALDGNLLHSLPTVDGMTLEVHVGFVELMRSIVRNGSVSISRDF